MALLCASRALVQPIGIAEVISQDEEIRLGRESVMGDRGTFKNRSFIACYARILDGFDAGNIW